MAEEEARMSPEERDIAQEDYKARKDDLANKDAANRVFPGSGGRFDFERDSAPPQH